MDNAHYSRNQSLEHSARQYRIEGREAQDQPRRPLPHREITSTSETQEHQSISLLDWLRQKSEQYGIQIFGLNDLEMTSSRNQQVDQQSSSSGDSHSEPEEMGQEQISPQRREKLMEMYLDLREAQPLVQQPRSQKVSDALLQLDQFGHMKQAIEYHQEFRKRIHER